MHVGGSKGSISGNFAMANAELLVVIGSRAVCQADCSGIGYENVTDVINLNGDLNDIRARYPALSYNVYRDGELIANVSNSDYFDDADMEGHENQGLLYESSYDYTVTGINDAGESTDGHQVSNHDGSSTDVAGRQSDDSATTDDNIDPVAVLDYLPSPNGTNISDGVYEIPHDGSPAQNPITINADGSGSGDADEFDSISRFTWTQTSGPDDISLESADTDNAWFSASNPHDGSAKTYSFNLLVEADYPVKGGSATRSDNAQVSVTVDPEPNTGPNAAVDVIYGVLGPASFTMIVED